MKLFKKLLIFQKGIFPARKIKNPRYFLNFRKCNFPATRSETLLYFRTELAKPKNKKNYSFCLLRDNVSNMRPKEKSFFLN